MEAESKVKHIELSAVVIRCTCGDPDSHFGEVCPQGRNEDLGIIAETPTNPLKKVVAAVERGIAQFIQKES